VLASLVAGAALAGTACGHAVDTSSSGAPASSTDPAPGASPDRLAPLRAFEDERRRAADFARLPPSDHALGPDPIAIRAVPGASPARFVGLLRGRDALVLLDASLRELARAPAPALPTGLAVADDGTIAVSGEQSHGLRFYALEGDTLRVTAGAAPRPGGGGLRDVALHRARRSLVTYAIDPRRGRLLAGPGPTGSVGSGRAVSVGAGAFRVVRAGEQLVVDCLLDHALAIFDLDGDGLPADAPRATVRHDGPIWSVDAVPTPAGLLIAAGGVEDHPLDRTEGSFGYIDSFVYVYRLAPGAAAAEKLAAVNVSELGVVTPRALLLRVGADGAAHVTVAGYGADQLAELTFAKDWSAPPAAVTRTILPGAASMAVAADGTLVFADPLLDAWVSLPPGPSAAPVVVPVPDEAPPRAAASRVGEALFFTNLMAPWNRTEGRLSRFTCETCHFEGHVDGRTHHTGRGDVHATTKPLLGLFNNRPHFSRALDPDLATMVDNEFRVASANSGHDGWFTAGETGLPWVPLLGAAPEDLDALGLRRSLMTFLMDFTHRPNPAALGREGFTEAERRGADVFARRCEGCHEARLASDVPASRVPRERWEALVMSREGPIVWGASAYHKTGVEPYVHELGARAPSLRRAYAKRPYFTSGAAKTLDDVLARARFRGASFWHDHAPEGAETIAEADRTALLGFLELL
jgi:hypothetical protein